jgi:cell cycle checkpoint protein
MYILGTAFVFSSIFDDYAYTPPSQDEDDVPEGSTPPPRPSTIFELPLNVLVDCLNIFGTASVAATSSASLKRSRGELADVDGGGSGGGRGRGRGGRGDRQESGDENQSRLQQFFGGGEKGTTGLRMRFAGAGYPLTLSMLVLTFIISLMWIRY